MTQVFSETNEVLPVTAIDVSRWFIVGTKTASRDGYDAIKVALLKKRYPTDKFDKAWLKAPKKYFDFIKEVKADVVDGEPTIGALIDFCVGFTAGDDINVGGRTKGCGFAGVIRRYNFSGGTASHGSKTGRKPGSIGFMCSTGKVIKGKKLPGRMGGKLRTVEGLSIVRVDGEAGVLLVKGAVPGKAGSLVTIRKGRKQS